MLFCYVINGSKYTLNFFFLSFRFYTQSLYHKIVFIVNPTGEKANPDLNVETLSHGWYHDNHDTWYNLLKEEEMAYTLELT